MNLKYLTEEEFKQVKDIINKEYQENIVNNRSNYVNFQSFSDTMVGIYLDNTIIGIIKTVPFIGQTSLEIYIFPDYRGHNYASMATQMFIEKFGNLFNSSEKFLININPHNEKSLKVAKKLGWRQNYDYDDILIEEGAEYFYIFEYPNPYYVKSIER